MFRTVGDQPSLFESVLPQELLRLPDELARIDALLDDPAFFAPFVPYFDPRIGRPSTPMETYLRLMFLNFRYRLGYESLCRSWQATLTVSEGVGGSSHPAGGRTRPSPALPVSVSPHEPQQLATSAVFLAGYDQTSCKVRDFAPTEHVTPHIFTRQSQVRVHSWRSSQHRSSIPFATNSMTSVSRVIWTLRLSGSISGRRRSRASGNRLMRVITAILQINALS